MKVAIVGCGGIGAAHARAYQQIEGVTIDAFVDPNLDAARKHANDFGGRAVPSIDDIIGQVDAVSVTTPPHLHYAVTLPLLEAGLHVFSEKPLTMEPKQGLDLVNLAATKGLTLMTGFKMRFEPVFAKARELAPRLGRIHHLSTLKMQPFASRGPNDWRPAVGAMYELSIHDFDLIHHICRMTPVAVYAAKLDHKFGWEREDGFSLIVEYDNGATGCLGGSYQPNAKWFGRDFTLCIAGENGLMRVERPDRVCLHLDEFEVHEVDAGGANPFVAELGNFCDVVAGRARPIIDPMAGVLTTALVEAAVIADRERRRVELGELLS